MAYTFTQLAIDTFQRANESPLDPANWTAVNGALAVVSDQCVSTDSAGDTELYTGISLPFNQYAQCTIGAFTPSSGLAIQLNILSTGFGSGYFAALQNVPLDGGAARLLLQNNNVHPFQIITVPITSVSPGDVLTLGVVGTPTNGRVFALYNGVQVASGSVCVWGGNPSAGHPSLEINVGADSHDSMIVTSFSAGTVTGTVDGDTFSITGNVGVAGATVSYTGPASGSVVSDGAGDYAIDGLFGCTYTITPSLSGYTFQNFVGGSSDEVEIDDADVHNIDFTAIGPPPGPPRRFPVPLIFTQRTTAGVALFACINVAGPQGAQMLTTDPAESIRSQIRSASMRCIGRQPAMASNCDYA